ncbi:sugar ABC transporter permease [Elstera cyanobacteriorum]|uniref:Xylose transport system permease protein XylH n=1 Tax=Elstera cyanobacteriorum TaxID=2022747 RepID=A0A255XWY7_9PROT|nr:sugar ABC transporter permease [Elstera cyanobacteriorum]MCK6444222.1 sugar ABC transporter permease [Elstera cyanobacteriorum]OYQ20760.1 sugar ABC transporter permease [Elstera cyanobacteriorum]GFZ82118.1 sugar ABC transporter permease [Elstera cyanobacteriorum]
MQSFSLRRLAAATGLDTRLLAMAGALVLIALVFNTLSGGAFLSPRNLWNLAVQSSMVGILATGMVLVIVTRNIDLSVGSVLGAIGMGAAVVQVQILPPDVWWNTPLTILAAVIFGIIIGAFQGFWVAYRQVPSFIVTLAGLLVFRGVAWMVTEGRTVAPMEESFQLLGGGLRGSIGATWSWVLGLLAIAAVVYQLFRARRRRKTYGFAEKPLWGDLLTGGLWIAAIAGFVLTMNSYNRPGTNIAQGIPIPVLLLIGTILVMETIARTTRFGRYVFAYGGNPEAARLAGIDVRKLVLTIFIIMGILAAVAGILATARLNAGVNSTGTLAELSVIAAVVIGGTSLAGGAGSIAGAILGAVIMQSLENGMVLLGLPSALQQVVIGLVLILAVWADVVYRRRVA